MTIAASVGALALIALGASAGASGGTAADSNNDQARALRASLAARQPTAMPVGDHRSPDTRDAALPLHARDTLAGDHKSPDTRDAALALHARDTLAGDHRSPDTRDAALAAASGRAIPADTNEGSGFDWTDAGIGATGGFGIALVAATALLLIRRSNGRGLAV